MKTLVKPVVLFLQKTTLLQKLIVLLPMSFLTTLDTMIYPLIALVIMITLDLITSLVSYFRRLRKRMKRPLTFREYRFGLKSGGLRKTGIKFYQYMFTVFAVFIIEVFAFQSKIDINVPLIEMNAGLTEFTLWALTFIELKSIDENFKDTNGKTLTDRIIGVFKFFRNLISQVKGGEK